MNGNQGLEALAALCGGEAAVATDCNNALLPDSSPPGTITIQPQPSSAHAVTTQQQWQQAMAAAAAFSSATGAATLAPAPANSGFTTAQGLALLSAAGLQPALQQQLQVQQQQPPQQAGLDSNAALAAMQQLAYFRYIQDQTSAAIAKIGQNAASVSVNMNPLLHANPHQAVALALAGQAQQLQQQLTGTLIVSLLLVGPKNPLSFVSSQHRFSSFRGAVAWHVIRMTPCSLRYCLLN
jgi:hypothetical protein